MAPNLSRVHMSHYQSVMMLTLLQASRCGPPQYEAGCNDCLSCNRSRTDACMCVTVMCHQDGLQRHVYVKVMSSGGSAPAERCHTLLAVTDLVRPKSPNIYCHLAVMCQQDGLQRHVCVSKSCTPAAALQQSAATHRLLSRSRQTSVAVVPGAAGFADPRFSHITACMCVNVAQSVVCDQNKFCSNF